MVFRFVLEVRIRRKVAVAGLEVEWRSGSGNFSLFLFFIECMYLSRQLVTELYQLVMGRNRNILKRECMLFPEVDV